MDLLVKLENLPSEDPVSGIVIRRATPDEITKLNDWVASYFDTYWAKEVAIGFNNIPISIYVAVRNGTIVGFSAYECTSEGFLGPMGVEEYGQGIGRALLLRALGGLSELGYRYAIIHDVGDSIDFYQHVLGPNVVDIV